MGRRHAPHHAGLEYDVKVKCGPTFAASLGSAGECGHAVCSYHERRVHMHVALQCQQSPVPAGGGMTLLRRSLRWH